MTPLTITLHHQNRWLPIYELRWESQLNADYLIEATLSQSSGDNWLNQVVSIYLHDQLGPEQWLHGLVTACQQHHNAQWLTLMIHSECWPLRKKGYTGIYYDASVQRVLVKSLIEPMQRNGLRALTLQDCTDYGNHHNYPVQASITQYHQSDWAFVLLQLQCFGIWSVFWQKPDQVEWVAGDQNTLFWQPELPFCQWQNQVICHAETSLPRYLLGSHHDSYHDCVYQHRTLLNAYGDGETQWHSPFANLTQQQCAARVESIANAMQVHTNIFSVSFSHAFLQAGMLIANKGLLTKVKQHFVAANQGKGGGIALSMSTICRGLIAE